MSAVINQQEQAAIVSCVAQRTEWLRRLRARPQDRAALLYFYQLNPVQFVIDWIVWFDPRNAERGLPTTFPAPPFPAQVAMLNFIVECWRSGTSGLIEKSRDMGCSSLSMALAAALCILNKGIAIGVGSRKQSLVDNGADPASLFFKIRLFLKHLPVELTRPWSSADMRITFDNGSTIIGESGDALGRGGRTALFLIDESAHLERPELAEMSLASNTNCRIDISSVAGLANSFAQKRFSGRVPVHTVHWRSDPRKAGDWYAKLCETQDPLVIAQEFNIDYHGSTEGALIPSQWFQSAIGAADALGIEVTGMKFAALDPADVGSDKNALSLRTGIQLTHLESWSGADSDLFRSLARAVAVCDERGHDSLCWDGVGLGAGLKGDMLVINQQRQQSGQPPIFDSVFLGSASVWRPDSCMIVNRKNKDAFLNQKSQAYFSLRQRFQATHRAITGQRPFDPEALISIDPKLPELAQLQSEISQIRYSINVSGKLVIDKIGTGQRSPNLADSIAILYRPETRVLETWIKLSL